MRRLIQMDIEQSEILETTPEFLLRWLEAEVNALRGYGAHSLEYREVGKTTYISIQPPNTKMNKLEIVAKASVNKDDETVAYGFSWGVVMEFVAKQLNNNEIQLIAGYKNYPRIKESFDLLWKEILNVFPKRAIKDHIEDSRDTEEDSVDDSDYSILFDKEAMRQQYQDYSVDTAEEIIKNLRKAWEERRRWSSPWGPGIIADYSTKTPETISRYLGAFKKAGIDNIDGIEIPHRFKA